MPTFDTPDPIQVTIDIYMADLRITAGDRTDTVVEVRPSDGANESDVEAARQVRVDYADGTLRITGPKRLFDFSRKSRSVDLTVELPTGSQVIADVLAGGIRSGGRLGDSKFKISAGHLSIEQTGAARLSTGAGHVTAGTIDGNAEISTGTGKIQVGEIAGTAVLKNSNGDTTIDAVGGDARVRSANGAISVGRAGAGVDAKTSNGDIHIGEVVRGSVHLGTAAGDVEIGIAEGTAAWLQVTTGFGKLRNLLENVPRPEDAAETVEVRGRTSYGDITIRRS
jgi:DUF4097 and DUF4098 domain-containing protein YvlB